MNKNMEQLASALDGLRHMFQQWHVRGPHATNDASYVEQAILAMDVAREREEKLHMIQNLLLTCSAQSFMNAVEDVLSNVK